MVGDYSGLSTFYIIFLGVSLQNHFRSHIKLNFVILAVPTATGKAWYSLRNVASKLTRMEHHHQFLATCYEENIIPVGLCLKTNIGLELNDYMLPKYTADCNSFTFYHIQQLASDALVITKDLLEELTSIELDIRRRFPLYIANQLLDRTRTFLACQRRGRAKLIVLRRKFSCNKFLSRYSDVSAKQRQHNDFCRFHSRAHDFKRFYYCSIPQYCDNNFDNFVDDSLADFEESVNFLNFSFDHVPHVSLNQPV